MTFTVGTPAVLGRTDRTGPHGRRAGAVVLAAVTGLLFSACAGESSKAEEPESPREVASERAQALAQAVKTADEVHSMQTGADEAEAAVVISDAILECPTPPSIECGVVVEVWGSAEKAKQESGMTLELQRSMPDLLGAEAHAVDGPVVLRVNLDLPEDVVHSYVSKFAD